MELTLHSMKVRWKEGYLILFLMALKSTLPLSLILSPSPLFAYDDVRRKFLWMCNKISFHFIKTERERASERARKRERAFLEMSI